MGPHDKIEVIDLFAGPGGLGEGFASLKVRGYGHPFRLAISVENDRRAHRTLTLRAFYRQYKTSGTRVPESYYKVLRQEITEDALSTDHRTRAAWEEAESEAICAELGRPDDDDRVDRIIQKRGLDDLSKPRVLIGGPPCQAYSLVGRARNRGNAEYSFAKDSRTKLYAEYLRIITMTWPEVFVMENVKGILSSHSGGSKLFPKILEDLREPTKALRTTAKSTSQTRYRLIPLSISARGTLSECVDPRDFVLRCEEYGVPQRRHRVFVMGVREDLTAETEVLTPSTGRVSLWSTICDLPSLTPKVSGRGHRSESSSTVISRNLPDSLLKQVERKCGVAVAKACRDALSEIQRRSADNTSGTEYRQCSVGSGLKSHLKPWFIDPRLGGVCNHVSKSHMPKDLSRYFFASVFASATGRSPTLSDFPRGLLPSHKNARSQDGGPVVFNDRFRVQVKEKPATTITSHLAKDGHYFIHPDPLQSRAFTVREAARVQTFPDNYYFCGPKTSQYQQVGNAVPPLMASQIAKAVFGIIYPKT